MAGLDPQVVKSFDALADLVKQVITLSTGVIALTLSFLKDVVRSVPPRTGWLLRASWLLHGFSATCGVLAFMAIVGSLGTAAANEGIYRAGIALWVGLQLFLFMTANVLLAVFGSRAFAVKATPRPATPGAPEAPGPAVSTRLAEIQQLIQEGKPDEAQALLAKVQHDAVGIGEAVAWLRQYGGAYAGHWVAIRGGELAGSNQDRAELVRALDASGRTDSAVVVYVGTASP